MNIDKYQEGLTKGGRWTTMLAALTELEKKKPRQGVIVETGTTRMQDDWGAGMATLVFGDFAKKHDYELFTVDINPAAIAVCREVTKQFEDVIAYETSDSLFWLQKFWEPIDLLYLDSMDCPEYDEPNSERLLKSQMHQLLELHTAMPHLAPDPIILLDDNQFENGGKTRLSKLYLKERGFTEVMSEKQSLWIK